MLSCCLCESNTSFFASWQRRRYYHCSTCFLIQLNPTQRPNHKEEKDEYLLHNNDPYDTGYRRFLGAVTNPVLDWLRKTPTPNLKILDFGCGPGPAISVVLAEEGWTVCNYDPFFYPNSAFLSQEYDLITCTETVEHFHEPARSWKQLRSLLKPNGELVVMTQSSDRYQDAQAFQNWRYIREKSHVVFYHTQTMRWIAQQHDLQISQIGRNVFWFSPKHRPV